MSCSNCCFLTCMQVSLKTGKMVCHFYLFKNFKQFVVIHTVKGFSIEVDVFLEFPVFLCDPTNVGNLISSSSAFSKPNLYIWKFLVHTLLKPSLKDLEYNLANMFNECKCMIVWTFFGIGMNTDLFQSCGRRWVFQSCWHIECSTFTASPLGIIPLPSPKWWICYPRWTSMDASLSPLVHSSHYDWLLVLYSLWIWTNVEWHVSIIMVSYRVCYFHCPKNSGPLVFKQRDNWILLYKEGEYINVHIFFFSTAHF